MLCNECTKRDICDTLCPEAEAYADQDWVGLKEITMGLPAEYFRRKGDMNEKEISHYLNKLFAKPRKEQVRTLLSKGLSRSEIAQVLGITRQRVRSIILEIKKSRTNSTNK